MRGPDHVWPRFGLRFHPRLTSSEVSFSCIPQQTSAILQTVVSIRRIVRSRTGECSRCQTGFYWPKSTEIGLKPRNTLLELALTSRTYTASWINRRGPRTSTRHLHFCFLPPLHHSLPQFLQGILRPPPHAAVVPQGHNHTPQQRIDKQHRADP